MISFVISVVVLIVGYIVYGRVTKKIFSPDDRETPALKIKDGVDFVPMKTWKAFLVQLLNIAGTGPIFGALMGAVYGPIVFLWIVFGSILGGAVHDYMSGMISCRHNGISIAELAGKYLGRVAKWIMRIFSVVLLVLVGTVFVTSPAALLNKLTSNVLDVRIWVAIILIYFFLATMLPIDKIIGKLYPFFGIVLIIMAIGIFGGILFSGGTYSIPEICLENLHPDGLEVWPYMFVTVACGAISGFHATQSPMIAKCITSEKKGRVVFYGAMISESIIALVWAAAGVAFYGATGGLETAIESLGQSGVAYEISTGLLGPIGGILAVIGVVACPITSGDTAFRSARLVLSDWTGLEQKKLSHRLVITIPLLVAGAFLTQLDFDVLWRYFSWSNQTLAAVSLWVATSYLIKNGRYKFGSLITALPGTFMSALSITYILMSKEGLAASHTIAYPIGICFSAVSFAIYLLYMRKKLKARHNP